MLLINLVLMKLDRISSVFVLLITIIRLFFCFLIFSPLIW